MVAVVDFVQIHQIDSLVVVLPTLGLNYLCVLNYIMG